MEVRETTTNRCLLAGLSFALGVVVFATHANAQEGEPAETPAGEAAEAAAADAPAEVEAEAVAEPAAEVPAEPAKPEIKAVIAEGSSEASLNLGVAYYEDVNGELTIEKLVDGSANVEFLARDNREETPNFGLNPSIFWFKFKSKISLRPSSGWLRSTIRCSIRLRFTLRALMEVIKGR